MVSKKQDDRLPPGWKLEIRVKNSRKFKCYINLKTHKKFYSKVSMLRYIEDRSVTNKRSSTTKGHAQKSSEKKQLHGIEANESDEWLPSGWIMESRTRKSGARKGTMYKCYIDPATGSKFFSKPEVYRYLESMQSNGGSSQQREEGSSKHSSNNVVVQRTIDDELPSGWIREIRNKMIGKRVARSDPFYIDTATGLVFRSKPDALRYIRTGEISKHAFRRKNGSISGEEFALAKTSPPSSGEREKVAKTPTRKQLFADEGNPKQCISALLEASGTKETGSRRITRSSSRVGLAPVHEASLEQSALLQPATIAEEIIPEKSLTEKLAATEVGPKQCISAPTEASGIKETGSRRSTRSSSRIGLVPVHGASLEQSTLLQPATIAEEMIPEKLLTEKLVATEVSPKQCISALPEASGMKETGSRRSARSSSRIGPVPVHEASLEQSTSLQPAIIAEEMIPEESLTEKLAATDVSPKQCISALPEASGIRQTGSRRHTRSSSRAGLVAVHEASLEHSTLLHPAIIAEEMIPEKSLTEKLAATEVSPKQCVSALPEASGTKETGSRRNTRSSSRFGPVPVHEASLEQSTLLQPEIIVEEMIPEKSSSEELAATEVTEGMTKLPAPNFPDIDGRRNDDTHWESKPSTVASNDILMEEKPETVALKGCSNEKAQVSKRKMKDRKTPTLPSRSSRRLAGGDAEVVFHAKPIEHALRATNRSSRKNRANPSLGSISSESQDKPQTLNVIAQNGLASQEENLRPLNIDTQTVLATQENSSKEMDIVIDIVTQINAQVLEIDLEEYPPGFDPRTEALPTKLDQSSIDPTDTLAASKMEKSPRDSQLTEREPERDPTDTLAGSKMEKSPRDSQFTEREVETDPKDTLTGSKMEKFLRDSQLTEREPETDPTDTLAGSKMEKFPRDSQLTERELETDPTDTLAGSKMEKSPGDSQLTERELETLPEGNIDKSSGEPETLPEARINKSFGVGLSLEEQQDTGPTNRVEKSTGDCLIQVDEPAVVERDLEQADSQFSLSSPLWSDPCLEFAYKTLTGAIPLDDNLAIEDYIQHQLRTSERSNNDRSLPDIGMPSFFQSHEPKPGSPFPKDVSIPNSNGFGSQRPSR